MNKVTDLDTNYRHTRSVSHCLISAPYAFYERYFWIDIHKGDKAVETPQAL